MDGLAYIERRTDSYTVVLGTLAKSHDPFAYAVRGARRSNEVRAPARTESIVIDVALAPVATEMAKQLGQTVRAGGLLQTLGLHLAPHAVKLHLREMMRLEEERLRARLAREQRENDFAFKQQQDEHEQHIAQQDKDRRVRESRALARIETQQHYDRTRIDVAAQLVLNATALANPEEAKARLHEFDDLTVSLHKAIKDETLAE